MVEEALWLPDEDMLKGCNLSKFIDWLSGNHDLVFDDYETLWEWSVEQYQTFWSLLLDYFQVAYDGDPSCVVDKEGMPGCQWFPDLRLNYAEHVFRNANSRYPALIHKTEFSEPSDLSWDELSRQVSAFQQYLIAHGIEKGDRVVAFISNIKEATVAFLATIGLGAVWSSCSPDFGKDSVIDRFAQIKPKLLLAVDGYSYNGKTYDKRQVVAEIVAELDEITRVVSIPQLGKGLANMGVVALDDFSEIISEYATEKEVIARRIGFNDPLWVLYSSGTTGNPKAITHSHGGILLEHLKYLVLHNDVRRGERFFWYSTTGWMMWNFVHASLLAGATIVLYDGSAAYPDLGAMWELAEECRINHFGTSAPFLVACMKQQMSPGAAYDLSELRSIGSTGSPLPPEAFEWVYASVKETVWLCSMSGGTDVCTAFMGGNPIVPVYVGRIQSRALGCGLYSWDDEGNHESDRVGEMIISKPMPCMPIYFWNDKDYERYRSSYFEHYPGIWRHGDWVEVKTDGSLIIYGRSDATLNRHGVRIGTSEIYRALNKLKEIKEALIVNLELSGGRHYMPLFVVLNPGYDLEDHLIGKIKATLRQTYTPRHVPDEIIEVNDIPFTISGKKMEAPVKKILLGYPLEKSVNMGATRNPESIDFFVEFAARIDL